MFQSRLFVASLMVVAAVTSRILPHPPNFTPLLAVSLFSGAFLSDKRLAYAVPLLAMLISDLYFGFHSLMPVIYPCMALGVYFGFKLQSARSIPKTLGYTLAGSVLFFIVTNFAVWLTSGMYPLNGEGLTACFTLAIPFFQNSIAGDLVYTGALFGGMYLLERMNVVPTTNTDPIKAKI
ncbi:DUF6580 family putative transport protein [Leptospira ilyithenensis]|uniref:Rod shape-determining protein MreD n=1 Tax=Leptospira ilyithenensis TaxID=2484901 RepID=A0A4V3JWR5_9LEPT|nr:DUF6580 family putative transport protein [Leptospira ilyithenensis]TGN07209.1 hypothetical protein EHS11_17530 [Leptospira ilyithenensis]